MQYVMLRAQPVHIDENKMLQRYTLSHPHLPVHALVHTWQIGNMQISEQLEQINY